MKVEMKLKCNGKQCHSYRCEIGRIVHERNDNANICASGVLQSNVTIIEEEIQILRKAEKSERIRCLHGLCNSDLVTTGNYLAEYTSSKSTMPDHFLTRKFYKNGNVTFY